jgi:hypothetical protein
MQGNIELLFTVYWQTNINLLTAIVIIFG